MSDTVKVPWEWEAHPDTPGLPPNLTRRSWWFGPECEAWTSRPGDRSFYCTRRDGHTGRHAAGGIRYILAVWS